MAEQCASCGCELRSDETYTCDDCHEAQLRRLLASNPWIELAVKRPGDRPDETLHDAINRELYNLLNKKGKDNGKTV
tara:strand:+ start:2130 stop:2360 length:231 start_codon:yes stop_codon:yes gene_type:complete